MKNLKHSLILAILVLNFVTGKNVSAQTNIGCLVGHYTMTGNADDSSPYGNDCSINGATLTTDRFGTNNSAFYFDGSSSLYTSLNAASFEQMTVTAWVKTTYTERQSTIVQIVNPVLYTNRFNTGKFFGSFNGTTHDNTSSEETVTDVGNGNWVFVAAVCNGATTKLYVNDVLESTYNESLYTSNGQLTIGLQSNNMWGFVGSIDEVRIYNCALSNDGIKDIYDAERTLENPATGVQELNRSINNNGRFNFYPNPADDRISINLNDLKATYINIKDVAGKTIYGKKINSDESMIDIDISNYNAGTYIIEVQSNSKLYYNKLIVK